MKFISLFFLLLSPAAYATPSDISSVKDYYEFLSPKDIIQVSVSKDYACGLRASGKVICWGANRNIVGNPYAYATATGLITTKLISVLEDITYISTNDYSAYAVSKNGDVYTWGWTQGKKDPVKGHYWKKKVKELSNAKSLVTRDDKICAITEEKKTICKELHSKNTKPTEVKKYDGAVSIALNSKTDCAVVDGKISCRGAKDDFESFFKKEAFEGNKYNSVHQGKGFWCALKKDGFTECFTKDELKSLVNPLGYKVKLDDIKSKKLQSKHLRGPFLFLSSAETHFCGILREDRRVRCWGYRDPIYDESYGPKEDDWFMYSPTYGEGALAVSNSDNLGCAIFKDKSVRCWGLKFYQSYNNEALAEALGKL